MTCQTCARALEPEMRESGLPFTALLDDSTEDVFADSPREVRVCATVMARVGISHLSSHITWSNETDVSSSPSVHSIC